MNYLAQVNIGDAYGSPFDGTNTGLGDLATLFLSTAIVIAGVVLLFLIVGAGFKIVSSAGNNDPKSAGQGKQALTYALIGFFIIFGAYWIIRILEEMVGVTFFTNPGI